MARSTRPFACGLRADVQRLQHPRELPEDGMPVRMACAQPADGSTEAARGVVDEHVRGCTVRPGECARRRPLVHRPCFQCRSVPPTRMAPPLLGAWRVVSSAQRDPCPKPRWRCSAAAAGYQTSSPPILRRRFCRIPTPNRSAASRCRSRFPSRITVRRSTSRSTCSRTMVAIPASNK